MASLGGSVGAAGGARARGSIGTSVGRAGGTLAQAKVAPAGTPIVTSGASIGVPRSGYVRFQTAQAPFVSIDIQTTGEASIPTADTAWDASITRPLSIDAVRWVSGKPLRQEIPITMDVLATALGDSSLSVDDEWSVLEKMWRPAGGVPSPPLRISGPVSHADRRWVIADLAADQDTLKRIGSRLVRVRATVSLLQYVPADLAGYTDEDVAKNAALTDRPRFTTSKQGDTLRVIAKRELGDGRKWTTLRDLNKAYKTATAKIPANTQIRLPNA